MADPPQDRFLPLRRLWDFTRELWARDKNGVFSKHGICARPRDDGGTVIGRHLRHPKSGELPLHDTALKEFLDELASDPDQNVKRKALFLRHFYQDRLHPQAIRVTQVLEEQMQRLEHLRISAVGRQREVNDRRSEAFTECKNRQTPLINERTTLLGAIAYFEAALAKAADYYGVTPDYFIPTTPPTGFRRLFARRKKQLKEPIKRVEQKHSGPTEEDLVSLAAEHNLPLILHRIRNAAVLHPTLALLATICVGMLLGYSLAGIFDVRLSASDPGEKGTAALIMFLGIPLALLGRYALARSAFSFMQRHYLLLIGSHMNTDHTLQDGAAAMYRKERGWFGVLTGLLFLLFVGIEASVQYAGVVKSLGERFSSSIVLGVCVFLSFSYLAYALVEGFLLGEDTVVRNFCRFKSGPSATTEPVTTAGEVIDAEFVEEIANRFADPIKIAEEVDSSHVGRGKAAAFGALLASCTRRVDAINIELDLLTEALHARLQVLQDYEPDIPDDYDEEACEIIEDAIADWEHAQEEFDRMIPDEIKGPLNVRPIVPLQRRFREVKRTDWWSNFLRWVTRGWIDRSRKEEVPS